MKYLNDVTTKDCVGKVCKSLNSGDFKVLKYNDYYEVEIQFTNTGFETSAQLGSIRNGKVKDLYAPSVCGVGVIGAKYPVSQGGRGTKEYRLWCGMLRRCYSDSFKKQRPTYGGCEVSDNFKSYEYFYEWCNNQIGFNNKDWHLDKDLLTKGNKVYSENVCVFIPSEINSVLVKCTASRGKHLIGVHWCNTNKAFVAQVNRNKGQPEHLGLFKTEIEAFKAYKQAKEAYLKGLANKWEYRIDPRAYNALMNYTVEITD
jgi:hypothetical protein